MFGAASPESHHSAVSTSMTVCFPHAYEFFVKFICILFVNILLDSVNLHW